MFLLELLVNNDTSHSMQRSATIDLRFPALSFLFGLGRGRIFLLKRFVEQDDAGQAMERTAHGWVPEKSP